VQGRSSPVWFSYSLAFSPCCIGGRWRAWARSMICSSVRRGLLTRLGGWSQWRRWACLRWSW
jgi:hypothetical protein